MTLGAEPIWDPHLRDGESEAQRGHKACSQQVGARPGNADFRSGKRLLLSLLEGTVEVEPLRSLPRHLSLCLVLNTHGPGKAEVSGAIWGKTSV